MRKTTVLVVYLLAFSLLQPYNSEAQSSTIPSVCKYQKTRNSVPINLKTNKPYAPGERNQEPFDGGSITKDEIRQCLQAKTPIKNHHIVFEDYRDTWQELAKETGDYTIPLLIEGSVLHAHIPYDDVFNTGGIRLRDFRDLNIKDASIFTDKQLKVFGIEKKNTSINVVG